MSATNSRMFQNWYQEIWGKQKCRMTCPHSKHNLLPFLQQNKDICQLIQQYGCECLHELSMELMCKYLHDFILLMVEEQLGVVRGDVGEEYPMNYANFQCLWTYLYLPKYHLPRDEPTRIKKGYYYIDGYEKPATVEYCNAFVEQYLSYGYQLFQ